MKRLNSKELTKTIRHNVIMLIIGLLFLIISIILIYIGYQEQHNGIKKAVEMNKMSGDLKDLVDKNAYIDVAISPFLFATYNTKDNKESDAKFYLVMDQDNFLYVVYMTNKDLARIDKDISQNKKIRITGVTEEINSQIKELAIESYNKELGEEYLSLENFDEFVGPILLNTTYILDNSSLYYIGSIISFCLFVMFIFIWFTVYIKNRKVLKKYSKEELEKIGMQIYSMGSNPYQKLKMYLTKDYVVDLSQGLTILKYSDIIWAYPYEYRYNGLLVNKSIKVIDKKNHAFDIANTKYIKQDKEKVIEEVLTKLKNKNNNIIIGFSKEIKKTIKEKVKNGESLENLLEDKTKKNKNEEEVNCKNDKLKTSKMKHKNSQKK